MLFISNTADFRLKLRDAKSVYTPKGDLLAVEPKIKAIFQHGVAPQWAVEQAQAAGMIVTGKPDGTLMQPYFSAYDTSAAAEIAGWDAETQAWVEQRLLSNPAHGSTYIRVEPVRLKAPWPAYDKLVAQGARTVEKVAAKIAEKVLEDGYDPADVIAYEAENANRPRVIETLRELALIQVEELVEA